MPHVKPNSSTVMTLHEDATSRIDQERAECPAAWIRVVNADASPRALRLGHDSCTIGSGRDCNIVVHEATVSRQHARLTVGPDGILVEDLGSTNGTFYLGHRIERMRAALGATILLGKVALSLEADDAMAYVEQTPDIHGALSAREGIVAASASMRRLLAIVERMRHSSASVLVTGESGVGKELIAQAIHGNSTASTGPFVAVNCGALARDLVASELFGHRRGAFTGADSARDGAFVSADGGTLFLDEIGELPLDIQPALLRVLERGEVRAVGGDRSSTVRVRVIAATHRDLRAEVAAGRFREDLYYRLAVVNVHVPPLRERPEDIEPLVRAFARTVGLNDLPPNVLERWKTEPWHGNVRELRNAVSAFAALGIAPESRRVTVRDDREQAFAIDLGRSFGDQKDEICDRFTRAYLEELLEREGGNLSKAARVAGLDRSYLGRLISKLGLGRSQPRRSD